MDKIVRDLAEPGLIAALEANMAEELFAFGRYRSGAILHDDAELQWFITGLPSSLYNGVVRTSLVSVDIDAKIEATLEHFRAQHVPISWIVTQVTQPTNLATYLRRHGFTHVHSREGMAANMLALHKDVQTPANFHIAEVDNQAALKTYFQVSGRGFDSSADDVKVYYDTYTNIGFGEGVLWRHYIGWLNTEPVAVSSLLLHAGVAGIYGVTTIPEARKRGIGTAMTLAPLREARRRGYRVGVLAPSEMGMHVYRRLGFREYCEMNVYEKDL